MLFTHEGVVGAVYCVASQHNDFLSLACLKKRDSCMAVISDAGVNKRIQTYVQLICRTWVFQFQGGILCNIIKTVWTKP